MWGRRRARLRAHIPQSPWRRLALVGVVALIAVGFYFSGQRAFEPPPAIPLQMTTEQEVALGAQATALLLQQRGGLDTDEEGQALLRRIGERLIARSEAGQSPYRFTFHLLADSRTTDIYVLPGGAIVMTAGLAARLRTEGEFAAVLAHALAHTLERHPVRQIEQQRAGDEVPSVEALAAFSFGDSAQVGYTSIAAWVAQALAVTYGPEDEAQADARAVAFMIDAGYDPQALMRVLQSLTAASATNAPPAFLTTHPNPEQRLTSIRRRIERLFLQETPEGLIN